MWFVASQSAPFGREIKLSQGIVAVILMGLCSVASSIWLMPLIGHWHLVVLLVVWPLIIMPVLELSFWRSFLAVIVYLVVMTVTQIGMALIAHYGATQMRHG